MSGESQHPEDVAKISNEGIKFVAWAIGIGAGSTLTILVYAHTTFITKDVSAATQKTTDAEVVNLKSAIAEMKNDNKDFQKWLRENWHKRNPE